MAWDPALLRRFSCTGHFRLLNQVRSELMAQPLIRDAISNKLTLQSRPFRGSTSRVGRRPNAIEGNIRDDQTSNDITDNLNSFKERLDAIDVR